MLVLATSMGAIVYQHYCGNTIKEVSLAKIDKHCQDHLNLPACHHSSEKKDCCKTEKQSLNTTEKQVNHTDDYSVVKKGSQFVTVFYVLVQYLFTNPFDGSNNQTLGKVIPDPPPADDSKVISYQSFLI